MPMFELEAVATDGRPLGVKLELPEGQPRAVVLLVHGMQEHSGRYGELGLHLAARQLVLATFDLRGHGERALQDGPGELGPRGCEQLLEDLETIALALQGRYPGLPLVLFGHSFGSFLAQGFAQRRGDLLAGLVLSGSGGFQRGLASGLLLARAWTALRGPKRPAGLLQYLAVGHFDGPPWATPTRAWITSDPVRRQAYLDDPACGGLFPNGFFVQLLTLLTQIWNPANERRLPRGLPVLMFSGKRDPVGFFGRGPKALARRYASLDLPVTLHLYPDARHECLNERNREQVLADLDRWFDEVLS